MPTHPMASDLLLSFIPFRDPHFPLPRLTLYLTLSLIIHMTDDSAS